MTARAKAAAILPMMWRAFRATCFLLARAGRACARLIARGWARVQRKSIRPVQVAAPVEINPSAPGMESIFQQVVGQGARIIGLTGVDHDSGVSTIARALARRGCAGGQRVLLVDASFVSCSEQTVAPPGVTAEGFHKVDLRPTADVALPMRDLSRLRRTLHDWLKSYDMIIVDMAPPLPDPKYTLPATVVSKACDATLLVCLTGRVTQGDLELASGALRNAGAPLAGVIVNHREQPTLGAEMAREAERLRRFAPGVVARLQKQVGESKFLNVHA